VRRARPLASVARAGQGAAFRQPSGPKPGEGERPPAGRCGPPRAGPARRSSSSPHFACGAGAPPEVPGGGTTFGSPVLGAGFSMVGSTSFGWMTPFDRFSFSLRFSPGAELSGAAGVGSGLPGAWANTEPATMVTPAINRQSREPIFIMHPLNWLMCGPFPGARIAIRAAKAGRPGSFAEWRRLPSFHGSAYGTVPGLARGRPCRSEVDPDFGTGG
jgi:hypothetical protein